MRKHGKQTERSALCDKDQPSRAGPQHRCGRNRTAADRLKGHSAGLYGAGGYYDFERNYTVHGEYGPLFKEEGDVIFDYFGPTKAAVSLVIPFYGKEGRK